MYITLSADGKRPSRKASHPSSAYVSAFSCTFSLPAGPELSITRVCGMATRDGEGEWRRCLGQLARAIVLTASQFTSIHHRSAATGWRHGRHRPATSRTMCTLPLPAAAAGGAAIARCLVAAVHLSGEVERSLPTFHYRVPFFPSAYWG